MYNVYCATCHDSFQNSPEELFLRTCGEVKVEWKIKNFFNLPSDVGYVMNSKSFLISDARYYMQIYPAGKESIGWVSLYLRMEPHSSSQRLEFTFGIKAANGTVFECVKHEALFENYWGGLGISKFITRDQLHKYNNVLVPYGTLTVFCIAHRVYSMGMLDGGIVEVASKTSTHDGVKTLSQNFKELYLSKRQGDVTIRIQDKELVAHKLVLSARSTVFRTMFEVNMVENNIGILNITDCNPEIFEDFLLFLYTGNSDVVTSDNAFELYCLAEKYNLMDLKQECSRCIASNILTDTVCSVIHLAELYRDTELSHTAAEFFFNNAEVILKTPEWFDFLADHQTMANELLAEMANN